MFKKRKLLNRIMYIIAIMIAITMVLLTLGPSFFQ